jgi:hypothetical protein
VRLRKKEAGKRVRCGCGGPRKELQLALQPVLVRAEEAQHVVFVFSEALVKKRAVLLRRKI